MKKIENYVLPENTNNLYKEEAISSIGLTRDVADKINELVDAYNTLSQVDLEWKQTQEGIIRKGVVYLKDNLVNSIRELLELYLDNGTVDAMLADIITGTTSTILKKTTYVTPEMYGAVGDGIQDDTEALHKMFRDIEAALPTKEFENEEPCKDYSVMEFQFRGKYKISKPLTFESTYGLVLNNLKLSAANNFEGEGLLVFNTVTRNFKATNMTLNGNLVAEKCIAIHDYTLTFDLMNVEITHFTKYGIYADGKGHELKINNAKVNQFEWGEKTGLLVAEEGTGIYLGPERHDNHISQLVANYCKKSGLEIEGGTSTFMNCHFYSCDVLNKGRYNQYVNCYFDNAPFKTMGFFTLSSSLLLKSGADTTPFIYLLDATDEGRWLFDTCNLSDNNFKSETQILKAVDLGEMTENPRFNTIGNTFYYVTPFTYHAPLGHTRNPWDEARESYGDEDNGYKIYGNMAIIWGMKTGNGFCTYPNELTLKETISISFERQDNANPNLIPWANTIKNNQFWANSVGENSTVKWVVIGIV